MRLIDADIIQGKLATLSFYTDGTFEGKIVEYVRGLIDAQPTIDAVPVAHAHWIKSNYDNIDGTIYECSNCNTEMFSAWNYCPNCGAKMDEELGL